MRFKKIVFSNSEKVGTKLEKKIHHSNVNNKWAKINTGGMGTRRKKKEKENLWDFSQKKEKWFSEDRGRRNTKSEEWKLG